MIHNALGRNISMLVRPVLTIIADIVIMFAVCWQLTLAALAGIVMIAVWNNTFRRRQMKLQREI
jgi:ABC-type multidrug transport system fused ATPase/permease subunit